MQDSFKTCIGLLAMIEHRRLFCSWTLPPLFSLEISVWRQEHLWP
jgi:hypothetical protein